MKSVSIIVRGKVQGVWFRASTAETARKIGIKGFVRNLPDGTVYIEAEADEHTLAALIAWCREGSPFAEVSSLTVEEIEPAGFSSFEVSA